MGPTLTALMFAGASSAVAHAQGTMDFSGATTLMDTFKTSPFIEPDGQSARHYSVPVWTIDWLRRFECLRNKRL